ncbi:MAG: hypothetical protein AAGF86_20820 [Pseudomonadota bacterium]
MQQVWLILLAMGFCANVYIAWLAFQGGSMGHVVTGLALAALCAGVAYIRIKQMEKR